MINDVIYEEVLDKGLNLDHYYLLCRMKRGEKIIDNKRVRGFINLLTKKGYIDRGNLTEKALEITNHCMTESSKEPSVVKGLEDWAFSVHKKCQMELLTLTGKPQIRAKVERVSYAFLPNSVDLAKTLIKVITIYNLSDYEKIEQCLISYIRKCHKQGIWFPLLKYYIFKLGSSQMVTDLQSGPVEEVKSGSVDI